jgi:hypothetical protein
MEQATISFAEMPHRGWALTMLNLPRARVLALALFDLLSLRLTVSHRVFFEARLKCLRAARI